jgi:hypothetical protein
MVRLMLGMAVLSGMELGRMSRARHGLYLVITKAMLEAGVRYTLPPYQGMAAAADAPPQALRPPGEAQGFLPPFLQKGALHL